MSVIEYTLKQLWKCPYIHAAYLQILSFYQRVLGYFWVITRIGYVAGYASVPSVMMTSPNGNIFRVTGPLCGEFTGHRWIPRTNPSDADLWCFIWSAIWTNGWVNNREAGDLKSHRAHYDVTAMWRVAPSGGEDSAHTTWHAPHKSSPAHYVGNLVDCLL